MAGTTLQDLWDRYHPLPRMSERKNVDDGAAASLSMQQPLVEEINPMNHATTDGPPACENYILFRHGPLCQESRIPIFIAHQKTSLQRYRPRNQPLSLQKPNKAPYPPAGR